MPTTDAYCEAGDLILGTLGDVRPSSTLNPETYVQAAAREMNSRLGYIYKMPLVWDEDDDTVAAAQEVLWKINVYLASGRFLLAVASAHEDDSTHAYGNRLIREAFDELAAVLRGDLPLPAARTGPVGPDAPSLINADERSGVSAFEDHFFADIYRSAKWRPGSHS